MRGDAERGVEVLNIAVQNKRQFTTPANEHVYGDSQPKGHEKCCAFPKVLLFIVTVMMKIIPHSEG